MPSQLLEALKKELQEIQTHISSVGHFDDELSSEIKGLEAAIVDNFFSLSGALTLKKQAEKLKASISATALISVSSTEMDLKIVNTIVASSDNIIQILANQIQVLERQQSLLQKKRPNEGVEEYKKFEKLFRAARKEFSTIQRNTTNIPKIPMKCSSDRVFNTSPEVAKKYIKDIIANIEVFEETSRVVETFRQCIEILEPRIKENEQKYKKSKASPDKPPQKKSKNMGFWSDAKTKHLLHDKVNGPFTPFKWDGQSDAKPEFTPWLKVGEIPTMQQVPIQLNPTSEPAKSPNDTNAIEAYNNIKM